MGPNLRARARKPQRSAPLRSIGAQSRVRNIPPHGHHRHHLLINQRVIAGRVAVRPGRVVFRAACALWHWPSHVKPYVNPIHRPRHRRALRSKAHQSQSAAMLEPSNKEIT